MVVTVELAGCNVPVVPFGDHQVSEPFLKAYFVG